MISLFFAMPSFANDHAAPEGGHEAPAEGGHGGGEEKAAAVEAPANPPWMEAENKVQELSAKLSSKKSQIQNLLLEKKSVKEDSPQMKVIVTSLLKEHAELTRFTEDYERNLNLLKYRFPERSAKNKRFYKKIELQSIDDIEEEMGIDGKLSRNMQKMRQHYGVKAPSEKRVPASIGSGVEKIPEGSIENPAPIIIKK